MLLSLSIGIQIQDLGLGLAINFCRCILCIAAKVLLSLSIRPAALLFSFCELWIIKLLEILGAGGDRGSDEDRDVRAEHPGE